MEQTTNIIQGIITDENEKSYFIQKNGVTYQLDKAEELQPLAIGDIVEGFIYENSSKKKMITTTLPKVRFDHYGWATVTEIRKDLGVFVHIGLPDKDMVVSLDELSNVKSLWPKKNNRLYVKLKYDKKQRIWATLADEMTFKSIAQKASIQELNTNKQATVIQLKLVGTYLFTDDHYLAFLHPSERFHEPSLGEQMEVRVIGVRPDGILNVSVRPRAHEAIHDDAQMLLSMLEQYPNHTLPYGDKTDPEIIKQIFGISKGQFKRAIGSLLKDRKIIQENNTIRLVDTQTEKS